MTIASGRSLTRGGSYLVQRVKRMAMALALAGGTRAKTEVLDGYLLRASATGGRGVGTVIDPPSALILRSPLASVDYAVMTPYQVRDWYDSRLAMPDETVAYADLPEREFYRIKRALYSWPSAPLNTPPGGLFPNQTRPWVGAGVEARYSVTFGATIIAASSAVFEEATPFGLPTTTRYGVDMLLFFGGQMPLQIHIAQSYLQRHAGSGWCFGPYMERPVDLRTGWPVSRAVQLNRGAYDVAIAGCTFHHAGAVPGHGLITHPRAGLYILAHSSQKMDEAWQEHPDDAAFEDGLLWQNFYALDDLFPVLTQQPYLCRPRNNPDYALNGGGDLDLASEAYKVWIAGYYTGDVPPVNAGRLPCFLNRLCLVATSDRLVLLAGVTFFTTADWFDMGGGGATEPLSRSQLFCCNALLRLQWGHDGVLQASELLDLDSSAGPDQLDFDGLGLIGRPADRSLFAQPCALLAVQDQVLELTFEWREPRSSDRQFSVYPYLGVINTDVVAADSGVRVRWAGKNLFFPSSDTGVFCWAKLSAAHPVFDYIILRDLPESEAPGAVQLSPTQIAFVGYRLEPIGRLVLCIIDLAAETFEVRSEIGPPGAPLGYVPPHPPNTTSSSQYQQPPSLSVAQQVVTRDGEVLVEGVLLFSFHSRYGNSLISRDSGHTWQVHITGAQSFFGVFYAPNALRANYESGTAAAVPEEAF